LYYDTYITFRILVKIIQDYCAGAGHFAWCRRIKNQKLELELKLKVRRSRTQSSV